MGLGGGTIPPRGSPLRFDFHGSSLAGRRGPTSALTQIGVPHISLLSNRPALAGGVGKEHEVGMEPLFCNRPCRRQVGRPFHWCFCLEPVFEHGSEPCAGVHGDVGRPSGGWAIPFRRVPFLHGSGRLAWRRRVSHASKTEAVPVRRSVAGAHH